MLPDAPLLSPRRLLRSLCFYCYFLTRDPPLDIGLWNSLRFYRRPFAQAGTKYDYTRDQDVTPARERPAPPPVEGSRGRMRGGAVAPRDRRER